MTCGDAGVGAPGWLAECDERRHLGGCAHVLEAERRRGIEEAVGQNADVQCACEACEKHAQPCAVCDHCREPADLVGGGIHAPVGDGGNPPFERGRQLVWRRGIALGDAQNRMVALPGRIFERRRDVLVFEQRTILENFLAVGAGGKQVENVLDANAKGPQAGTHATLVWVNRYGATPKNAPSAQAARG